MNCIHSEDGLCPKCQEEFAEDPGAWVEFGDHPQGIRNREELDADMERRRLERLGDDPPDMDEVPF